MSEISSGISFLIDLNVGYAIVKLIRVTESPENGIEHTKIFSIVTSKL